VAEVRADLQAVLSQSPRQQGLDRSRWWLAGLKQVIPHLANLSLPGIWKLLRRLGLRYKRGRVYLHSPDPQYALKMSYIAAAQAQAHAQPEEIVFLYEDELTYYRRPTLAQGWATCGGKEPHAHLGFTTNKMRRIAAVVNSLTGQVFTWQRRHFRVAEFQRFLQAVERLYPSAKRIFIALDNWPVHFHPTVLLALQDSPIMLLRLPTYAPWTNPVEKFWRLLKQQVLHLHDFRDDWTALNHAVDRWLSQWSTPSQPLLNYLSL
jgi:hypothetical protein